MNNSFSVTGTSLATITLLLASQALAEESITAEAFAARCADAAGDLTLVEDLRVAGGMAELGACHVTVGALRLAIEQAQFFSSGHLTIDGQADGELRIERSQFVQSDLAEGRVNIMLLAHHLRVEDTTLDFFGHVILRSGPENRGEVRVEAVKFRTRTPSVIHIGASGRTGIDGHITLRDSELVSEGDISIQASLQAPQGRGRIRIEENTLIARGTMALQTSGEGTTEVDENRILAEGGAAITSGGQTRVTENNFSGSGDVLIEGPRCQARDNIPEVSCR